MGHPSDYKVALNFWPLMDRDFRFHVYRRSVESSEETKPDKECAFRRLPRDRRSPLSVDSRDVDEKYEGFWVSLRPREGFEECTYTSDVNLYLARDVLLSGLKKKSEAEIPEHRFEVTGRFKDRLEYTLTTHKEEQCEERVWLEPYILRKTGEFGFLVDFRVKRFVEDPPSKKVQQISLSLDDRYRENKDFYADKYDKVSEFVNNFFHTLFPFKLNGGYSVDVKHRLRELPADGLDTKEYIFGGENTSPSQFKGVKRHGPLQKAPDDALLFFVYRDKDK